MVAPNKVDSDLISLNDIFTSIQGEGAQVGRPVIFVRLSKCNMSCWFCDTNYEPSIGEYTPEQLMGLILSEFVRAREMGEIVEPAVLLTGGEPTIYNLSPLLELLKQNGFWIGIESNGRNDFCDEMADFDHVTVSPKAPLGLGMTYADELRLVVQDFVTPEFIQKLDATFKARYYYLSPMEVNGGFNFKQTYKLLDFARKNCVKNWSISLQTHKLAGIK